MKSRICSAPRRSVGAGLVAGLVMTVGLTITTQTSASAAIPGLEIVTRSSEFNSSAYKSVEVHCPSDKRVIGTGYEFFGAAGSVVLDDLIPTRTSVVVGAGEVVGPGERADGTKLPWRIEATALCAGPLPGLEYIPSAPMEPRPSGVQTTEAACSPGKRLVGAGASLSQGFGQISIETLLVSDDFVVAAGVEDDDGFTGAWSITAYAVCADPIPGNHIEITATDPGNGPSQTATATCPAGRRALGAGWGAGGNGEVYASSVLILTNGVNVRADEDANGYGSTWDTTVYAICASQ